MKLGEIDLNLKPLKAKLKLCKPDRKIIGSLIDVHDVSFSLRLGKVNELNFTIPAKVERNNQPVDNPLIKKIKHRFLVKFEYNNQVDYLVFLEENKSYDDSGESISYRLYSEGYLLADKSIRDYTVTSKSVTYMLNDILAETNWKFGYVDSYFDTMIRSHEISSQTVLQAVYDLAEKFNAVIYWDTVNFRINFYNPSNIGMNKGLKFKEGKYLENFTVTSNSEEIVTRLKVYGNEGLSIRSLTPTGVNYLEDFSFFMYPFEQDAAGKVVKSSDYMSDSLALALTAYSKKLEQAQGGFDAHLKQLGLKQDELQQLEQQMSVLKAEMKIIMDELDVLNADGKAGTAPHTAAVQKRTAKEAQINTKIGQITTVKNQISTMESNWSTLRAGLIVEANLTPDQLLELNKYVIEKEHSNDTIIDPEDLLKDGIDAFNEFREPKVVLSMSIVNFLSVVESQNDWNRLTLGDIVTTESKRLNVSIKAKIIEIEYDFENDDIRLTIANEKKIQDDYDKWTEQLYNASQTATQVNMNKFKWDMIENTNGVVNQILQDAWNTAEREITAGYKQNIVINERGIVIKSPNDPMKWLVIQNGQIAMTSDNGNTWRTAVTPDGVFAEQLVGRLLLGTQLIIEDEKGIIRISGSLQEIFDKEGNVKVALGEYEVGKYGLKIDSGALEIVGGIKSEHIDPDLINEFSYDDTGIRNDLRLVAPLPTNLRLDGNGITATTSSSTRYARLDYRGLYVQGGAIDLRTGSSTNAGVIFDGTGIKAYNSVGTQTFSLNTNGHLTAATGTFGGSLDSANGTFTGNLSAAGGTFKGSLSAATGTFAGSLSAATGTFSGDLQAAGGTFSGRLSAATGTFSGNLSAAGGTFTGTLSGVNGTFTGAISGSQISGGTITGVTINVNTDLTVGNKINLGSSTTGVRKDIVFNSGAQVGGRHTGLASQLFLASDILDITATEINSNKLVMSAGSGITDKIEIAWNGVNRIYFDVNGVRRGWVALT